jgi:hypothetical protein
MPENGLSGLMGKPGVGGKFGNTAVKKVVRTETTRRKGGLFNKIFNNKVTDVSYSTHLDMTYNADVAASGSYKYTKNTLNLKHPIQLSKIALQLPSTIKQHMEFLFESSKTKEKRPVGVFSKEDAAFIDQVSM